jgi:hypothetical protein
MVRCRETQLTILENLIRGRTGLIYFSPRHVNATQEAPLSNKRETAVGKVRFFFLHHRFTHAPWVCRVGISNYDQSSSGEMDLMQGRSHSSKSALLWASELCDAVHLQR